MGPGKLAQVLLRWAAVVLAAGHVVLAETGGDGSYQAGRFSAPADKREELRVRRRGQETLRG